MTDDAWVREIPDGVEMLVRVIPRAGRTALAGVRDGRLLVRLAAAPVEGAANEALVRLFGRLLNISPSGISVASGAHHRNKRIVLRGVPAAQCRALPGASAISLPSERS